MKRYSEVVLNGHPDKFCDLVADRFIREAYKADPNAYAQIEMSVWSDVIFLTGGVATSCKLGFSAEDIVHAVGNEIGYSGNNHIDVNRYKIHDHICRVIGDPGRWTNFSNDQCIVVGYAGYDALVHYLPPEHFLAWYFREELVASIASGALEGQGPDGKVLVVMHEDAAGWRLDTLLVTLQQQESASFLEFTASLAGVLHEAYSRLQEKDSRWCMEWSEVRLLLNPNGPLLNGGSDGDNGQTGRKLVMDYYGPRIPTGGGAIYGKDLSHIDRIGAFSARRFALDMVLNGSKEALVKVCFAPGMNEPLSIDIASDKRPTNPADEYFRFSSMKRRVELQDMNYGLGGLGTFYSLEMSFNKPVSKQL